MQSLADFDKYRAIWLSQISFIFNMFNGYFVNELQDEIEIELKDVFDINLHLYLRDFPSEDVDNFFNVMVMNKYSQLNNILIKYIDKESPIKIIDFCDKLDFTIFYINILLPNTNTLIATDNVKELNQIAKNIGTNLPSTIKAVLLNNSEFSIQHPMYNSAQRKKISKDVALSVSKWKFEAFVKMVQMHFNGQIDLLRISESQLDLSLSSNYLTKLLELTSAVLINMKDNFLHREILEDILKEANFKVLVDENYIFGSHIYS